MDRRSFVQFNGLLGLGIVTGIPDAFYLLNVKTWKASGFDKDVIAYMDDVAQQMATNLASNVNGKRIVLDLLTPVEILKKKKSIGTDEIIYKNVNGSYVRYLHKNGKQKISFLKEFTV